MRRLPLSPSASLPHQIRRALLPSTHHGAPPWLASRRDLERFSSSTSVAHAVAAGEAVSSHEKTRRSTNTHNDGDNSPSPKRQPDHRDPSPPDTDLPALPKLPFKFETGISLFAKRAPRPFPPPFLSPPSGSFSDPLSTHHRSRDRRPSLVTGELIKGWTNGDDAAFASEYFICANDGVGAWSARPRGHAGLWARLILHFWATAMREDAARLRGSNEQLYVPDPIAYLQRAFEQTKEATSDPEWLGTTTAAGAQLFYKVLDDAELAKNGATTERDGTAPVLYVTNLGDSQVMVVRPSSEEMVFKTTEQWHWFDCPRQLGTNSPDTPTQNAVLDKITIREGDIVLAMSDGVIDNLWSHEIVENVSKSVKRWEDGEGGRGDRFGSGRGGMNFIAEELMLAAKTIAVDPFAESPFMERAIDEGLASEGGKLDDITVVAALCTRNID